MFQDNGHGDWPRLIREVISSWGTVFRVAVLALACTPCAAIAILVAFLVISKSGK